MKNEMKVYGNEDLLCVAEGYIQNEATGLALPKNYDWRNAVSTLYLQCVSLKTRDGQPVLEACTKESICRAVQDMLTKGLNPTKKQCYPIPYAVKDKDTGATLYWELQLQESYFGKKKQAYTNNLDVVKNSIHSQCIYKGDVFDYSIKDGKRIITKHEQKFENIKDENIIGAYATVQLKDGSTMSDIMTTAEIKKSWAMSKTGGNVHAQFTHEMCCKTVESRLAKHLSNATDDSANIGETDEIQLEENYIRVENIEDADTKTESIPETIDADAEDMAAEVKKMEQPEELKCSVCGKAITKKIYDYSMSAYGKPLCMTHQKEEGDA